MTKGAPRTVAKMAPASTTKQGPVKQMAFQAAFAFDAIVAPADFAGATLAALIVELNAYKAATNTAINTMRLDVQTELNDFRTKLITAGLMPPA